MQKPAFSVMQGAACAPDMQGIMGVFMREPLLDWQREARVVNTKRSVPASAKDPISVAETANPADMHVNLKVYLLTESDAPRTMHHAPCTSDVPWAITKMCPLCDRSLYHPSPHCLQLCKGKARETALDRFAGWKTHFQTHTATRKAVVQ